MATLTEAGFALRDEIDQLFDSPGHGPGFKQAKARIGDDVAWLAHLSDISYLLHYIQCREGGCGSKLADMLASRQPPMSNTDREFLEGHCCGNQFDYPGGHEIGDALRQQAQAAGVNTTGKVYLGGLAAFPGDPKAWISDRYDVKRVLIERGWGSQGAVNVAPRIPVPRRTSALQQVTKGNSKQTILNRLKAKGLSGDLLKGAD